MDATHWLISTYPLDIQGWIERSGGAERLPIYAYWIVPATELWKMGYRKCD